MVNIGPRIVVLNRMIQEVLTETLMFQEQLPRIEGKSHIDVLRRNIPGEKIITRAKE